MRATRLSKSRAVVKEFVDFARGFGADAGDGGEIGGRGALNRFERSEMRQQRALARGSDAGDLLQTGFADVAPPAHAV